MGNTASTTEKGGDNPLRRRRNGPRIVKSAPCQPRVSWRGEYRGASVERRLSQSIDANTAGAANDRSPQMLLKKSLLHCGKSFDSLSNEGIRGFCDDGDAIDTCTVVL